MGVSATVLMSVYHRVAISELRQCLASLDWQTRPADQVVIVIDGPIDRELQQALNDFQQSSVSQVELVPLAENVGLSKALNRGLPYCNGEWIIRMDADDISLPERFANLLDWVETHPETDVVGSALFEFDQQPQRPRALKPVATHAEQINKGFGIRNPINHPTVCMRKQSIEDVGGYPELPLLEDYFLWAKLRVSGAKFYNIETPLYLFRFDDATIERRGGLSNFRNEIWLRRWMYKHNLIPFYQMGFGILLQVILRLAPTPVRRWLWQKSRQPLDLNLTLPSTHK